MGKHRTGSRSPCSGFTMTELLVVAAILGILAVPAIPGFSAWMPKYRLKSSAQDLYSHLQSTKLRAIQQNASTGVSFYSAPDRYLHTGARSSQTMVLGDYGHGVRFEGPGGETYSTDYLRFDVRGFSNGGYAYLTNDGHTDYYRVGALSTGVVRVEKWSGTAWE